MATDHADYHEEEITEKPFDARLMWRLLGYLRPYWAWVSLAFALILVTSVSQQLGPYLTKLAVDDHILKGDWAGLQNLVLIYAAVLLSQFAVLFFQNYVTQMTGQLAMFDVRKGIFAHLQKLPLKFFDRTPIGRLMTRNTNDVDALNDFLTDGVVVVFSDIFAIFAIAFFMFWLDPELGGLVCLVLPVMFGITFWFQGRMLRAFRRARTRLARINAFLQENISGMPVVQLFNREVQHARRFDGVNRHYLEANLESTFYYSLFFPIMEVMGATAIALVIWYGGGEVLREEIEWGVLVAMLQYIPRFFRPVFEISERYAMLQAAMASSERIFELLDEEIEPTGGSVRQDRVRGEIEFDGVWFAYQDEDWVLKNVSFRVEPGQSVAFVGATGSGKTTVISLLCRFYDIQRGSIRVDGIDIVDWDVEALRYHIGIVQQDVFLFSGDIAGNIRLGNHNISQKQIEAAAQGVNADVFIRNLAAKYSEPVTERGSTLSAGQRQLLAFARALAFDPSILVLDEATANVDTETEGWIQQAVERLMARRTSIVIAHRISTIRRADMIIALHKGELQERGTHDELLAVRGIYHRLHRLQYASDEGDGAER
ncbi:MAG: ABC transporter ATP-binding protein [Candidatus Latescibacteria bacterium]|nr:ABC transporter ATP-binding protein [Candidatus Latescibacterota bacterium]